MPVTIKSGNLKYKNSLGQYVGIDSVAETSTAEQVAAIEAKGEEVLESIPQDYSELVDEVSEVKSEINSVEDCSTVLVETVDDENVYYIDISELSTSKKYELIITVGTAGTYTIKTGTGRQLADMVDTLATDKAFGANEAVRFYGYTPSATGVAEVRISSNTVAWSVSVREILAASDILKNASDIADIEEDVQSASEDVSMFKASVKQAADETLETGNNLYNLLDSYSVEKMYISTSTGKYSANNSYTLIVIPLKAQSGATLYWQIFESGTFTNADLRANVATTYPVVGESVSAQITMGTKRGFVALTENINYLLIGYLTSGYSGTVADIVNATTVNTTGWLDEYEPHYTPVSISEIQGDISNLQDDVNALDSIYETVRTSQLFNKDDTPGTLYVKSNGDIVSNTSVGKSWIVPLEANKRYLAYSTQTVHESFYISLCTELPAAGGSVSRKDVAVVHNVYYTDFTTGNDEVYALITYLTDFSYLPTDIQRYGLEQLDSGHNYKNEPYMKTVITADIDTDYISRDTAMDIVEKAGGSGSKWKDKKIWWCGTSIPNGNDVALDSYGSGLTYPEMVGELLGASVVYNEALGSSMARANVRTGDYVNAMSYNLLWSLTQTAEEKENLITNWSTIKSSLIDPTTFDSITGDTATITRNATFENRLLPYLDGTKPMPDLFVFDHGHNDWKSYYTMPDGTTPDTELEPTVANITGNILAEDTYMTANSNAKLISFFGEIANIPVAKQAEFIASVNRNCFIGAINFLCTLILSYNPRARIVFIGNLDNWNKPQVQPAQEKVAASWSFPLIRTWKYLGFSNHYVPNSSTFWSSSGTTDLIVKDIYCKDGIHPHSDTTGVAMELYAETIANALRNIV